LKFCPPWSGMFRAHAQAGLARNRSAPAWAAIVKWLVPGGLRRRTSVAEAMPVDDSPGPSWERAGAALVDGFARRENLSAHPFAKAHSSPALHCIRLTKSARKEMGVAAMAGSPSPVAVRQTCCTEEHPATATNGSSRNERRLLRRLSPTRNPAAMHETAALPDRRRKEARDSRSELANLRTPRNSDLICSRRGGSEAHRWLPARIRQSSSSAVALVPWPGRLVREDRWVDALRAGRYLIRSLWLRMDRNRRPGHFRTDDAHGVVNGFLISFEGVATGSRSAAAVPPCKNGAQFVPRSTSGKHREPAFSSSAPGSSQNSAMVPAFGPAAFRLRAMGCVRAS